MYIRDDFMSVNAISSYNYSSSVQYKYFHAVISDAQLKDLFVKYGIIPTGNADTDLDNLYQAMYPKAVVEAAQVNGSTSSSQQSQSVQSNQKPSQATEAQNSSNVPWANLMSQVGLPTTGDLATDYTAFSDKISAMQSSAAISPQDQAQIGMLLAEASIVFVQPNSSTQSASQASSSQPSQQQQLQAPTGADIQAQLNKMYILG